MNKREKQDNNRLIQQLSSIYKEKSPFSNYAFSLYLFLSKLNDACKKDGITDLFFLARDGQFLKELYDEFFCQDPLCKVETHYIYISRSSIVNATLRDLECETFEWIKVYKRVSTYQFLNALQFSNDEINLLCLESDMHTEFENYLDSDAFNLLKTNEIFKKIYDHKREQSAIKQRAYLQKCGLFRASKAAIVDVGWNGTIQNYLFQIAEQRELIGYYLGCYTQNLDGANKKIGLLFHSRDSQNPFHIRHYNYEYLCVADHGTTYGYNDFGDPILVSDNDIALYNQYYCSVRKSIKNKIVRIRNALRTEEDALKFEKYVYFFHAKMLLHFNREEHKILSDTVSSKQDNLINIKWRRPLKYYLFVIKVKITLSLIAFRHRFFNF